MLNFWLKFICCHVAGGPPLVLNMSLLEASLYRKRTEEKTEINSNVLTKPPDGSMAALSEHRLNVSPISSQHGIVDQSADFIAQDQLLLVRFVLFC